MFKIFKRLLGRLSSKSIHDPVKHDLAVITSQPRYRMGWAVCFCAELDDYHVFTTLVDHKGAHHIKNPAKYTLSKHVYFNNAHKAFLHFDWIQQSQSAVHDVSSSIKVLKE